ncbi:MAG TPA: HAMP domain-containing sensor histidine kinase [Hyphomicrobiaceae bacterium]|nr:HAMP domain-containing sensor histidine kinase [Hyphomicrobiaceae bacterium]
MGEAQRRTAALPAARQVARSTPALPRARSPSAEFRGTLGRLLGFVQAATGTTAFRLVSLYIATAAVVGALMIGALYWVTNDMLTRQLVQTLTVEAEGFTSLAKAAAPGAVTKAVVANSARPGRIYLLLDANGAKLAGNLDRWPPEFPVEAGGGTFRYQADERGIDGGRLAAGLVVTLPGDMRLLVARDLEPQQRLADRIKWLFLGGFGLLALGGVAAGLMASRLVLRRVEAITRTSETIMAGDLSGRVPTSGSGDELDHLATSLNAMLDRIEQLMAGLREVSDNIAHDLKTPLSRLRHRAEAALRDPSDAAHRQGLERVIEEADELIKTFNALLLIARLEAGTLEEGAEPFDPAALARDVVDLYAPVAEEAGLSLTCRAEPGFLVRANRHLIGQAVANLLDNAVKYGRPTGTPPRGAAIEVSVEGHPRSVAITVADRGPGIPSADRARALKRFVRLEASRTRPGTGLGLSLVAAVARVSGGELALEDNGPGLRVVLTLPRHGNDSNPATSQSP